MKIHIELLSGHVASPLLSGLKFRQPIYAKTHCFTSLWLLQERSTETICLPSTGQIALSQGPHGRKNVVEEQSPSHRGKQSTLTSTRANQRPCLNMALHLPSLHSSFDSGLSSNGNLNTCSHFTVQLAAEKKRFIYGLRMHEMQISKESYTQFSCSFTGPSHNPKFLIVSHCNTGSVRLPSAPCVSMNVKI